jgi:hypothetical protein
MMPTELVPGRVSMFPDPLPEPFHFGDKLIAGHCLQILINFFPIATCLVADFLRLQGASFDFDLILSSH